MKKALATTKMDVKKRKKNVDKQNPESKQGTKKRKETAKDRMLKLNRFYVSGNFGIWIQCTKCDKWRKVMEYEEEHEVPEYWNCSMSLSGARSCDEPEEIENADFSPVNFIPGTIVWAKYNGYPWWPGMIEDDPDVEEYYWQDKNGKWFYNVTFLDDKVTHAWVAASSVCSFLNRPKQKYLPASYAKYTTLLAAAEIKAQKAMNMSIQERFENFSFAHRFKGRWGSPLPSDDSDEGGEEEEGKERNITQMLLDEVNDIESIKSTNSDNRSILSLELNGNETDHEIPSKSDLKQKKNEKKRRKLSTRAYSSKEMKPTNEKDNVAHLKIQNDEENEVDNESDHEISLKIDSACEKSGKKLLSEAHSTKERQLTNEVYNVAHLKIQDDEANEIDDETNETDNESDHEISLKSDSACEKSGKKRKKQLNEADSSKERKLTDEEYNVAHAKTEIDKDSKTFVLPKGKKVKSTHIKPVKENNKDIILDREDENRKDDSKNKKGSKIMRISKVKNKKADKLENSEEKVNNAEENKEKTRSNIKKIDSRDAKTSNENKEENYKEKILNDCSNSKFKPPVKNNENNACDGNLSSMNKKIATDNKLVLINCNCLCDAESIIKEENLVKKEIAEENKQRDKEGIAEKKTKISKNAKNSKSVEENTNENELKENIVKILEKNLKSSLESMPMEKNNAPTSNDNDSSNTFQETLMVEDSKESKKHEKKESKMKHLKKDLADSEIHDNKKYSRKNKSTTSNVHQKRNLKNVMKVDSITDDLPVSNKGKAKLTDTFKVPIKQNINKKEKNVLRNLKTLKETEEIIQKQDNGIAYASDEDVMEKISCNDSNKETFSLSIKMNLQETEDEDSDPFEAE